MGRNALGRGRFHSSRPLPPSSPRPISASDISSYIDVNLPRLKRFIQRELDFREREGQLLPGQIAVDDVVGEAIAAALSEQHDKPERMKVEPWLYRLAKQAIDRLSSENREERQIADESVIPDPSCRYSRGAGGPA